MGSYGFGRQSQICCDAEPRARIAGLEQRPEQDVVAVRRLDEDLGFVLLPGTPLELADFLLSWKTFPGQVAAEGEVLALQSGSHQGHHDRRGTDQGHDLES